MAGERSVGVSLTIKGPDEARWDCVALGEVMLRLDPGDTRIRTARTFDVWEGGGEYNVARALRRCFGLRTAVVTALVDNDVGRLVETLMRAGGVDTSHVCWQRFDGFGSAARVGLNFTERGFGLRPARTVYDRGHTAAAAMRPGDVDWRQLFDVEGVRWLHTGGIFAALSPSTAEVLLEALQAAKAAGTVVSYDLNFRAGSVGEPGRPGPSCRGQPGARPLRRRDARQRGGLRAPPSASRSAGLDETCPNSTRRTSRR